MLVKNENGIMSPENIIPQESISKYPQEVYKACDNNITSMTKYEAKETETKHLNKNTCINIKAIEKRNKDLSKVKWNPDYVDVTYSTSDKGEDTCRLSEFWEIFKGQQKPQHKIEVLKVTENVICLLEHYNISIKFNIFKKSYEVWEKNNMNNLEDICVYIQDKAINHSFKISKDKLFDSLIYIAKQNKYNPIENYLKKCHKYYVKNPNNNIFKEIADTIKSECKYKDKYICKFLLQMVYLACSKDDDIIAGQYLLVLQGEQSLRKTTWFQNLLPKELKSKYFLGGRILDLNKKDDIMETVDNWLVEMGEISSTFRKSDQEAMKNFITSYKDKFRIPYTKEAIESKRRTTFCGTTNDIEYLKDLTGTRRFLTLNCNKVNADHEVDINMLWGYMYNLYLKKMPYWFDLKETKEITAANDDFLSKPESILILEEKFNLHPNSIENDANEEAGEWMKAVDIYNYLKPDIPDSKVGRELNKFTITKELKKACVTIKQDKHTKTNLFYVKRL